MWLNNPWVVGIGGGILSGILVTIVSRTILSRRDRREYYQKLLSANREVIYAIRPGISEGCIPDKHVVESLLSATARKYSIERKDLYDPGQISEELMKEVMDSSFISASTKQQYCEQLESLTTEETHVVEGSIPETDQRPKHRSELEEYRSRMVTMMSVMLGLMTTIMTILLLFQNQLREDAISSTSETFKIFLPMVAAIITALSATMVTFLGKEMRRASDKKQKTKEVKDNKNTDSKKDTT
ncbi:MAG: hypothetical protein KJ970_11085 [Candidatus Eisenbacteria bacterium]|uniref:Uncharacterized protein n=1 Tax=Eiseniibacteriota bacterium TaxID=2212470 RepID=A0A948RUX3_UNCEI|nr:hypothetical protein [Candidatus Eisenbacteria bacterium]MBU2691460.1 hypothetical protein [Candidatus Eisenbacteria bacterium]